MNGPRRLQSPPQRVALHGRDATRRLEQAALGDERPHALMGRAGLSVARLARALAPHARRVWIACGPGNNGGDGLVAARHLHALGLDVQVTLAADPSALPADARQAHASAVAAGVPIATALPPGGPGDLDLDLAIDAVLGAGSTRGPAGPLADLVQALNRLACPVLAVDLPSGLDADRGQPLGADGVRATHTLALLTLKPGLYTGAGRDHAGEIWFDDLGLAEGPCATVAPDAWLSAPAPAAPRRHAQHKGSFGDVVVVGGDRGMAGAPTLAARAALAAGAGRVHVDVLDAGVGAHDPVRPELMYRPADRQHALPPGATVVAGCGGGHAIAAVLPGLLQQAERLVLDADGLNAVSADPSLQALLAARAGRGLGTVLTPHPLEAARLLGSDTAAVQHDRVAAAVALTQRHGCVVVLKGSGTVVAGPGFPPFINPTGNAALATAGTGDVLAGWIAGVWATTGGPPLAAACQGTWQHGEAADRSAHTPLRAADLVEALHALSRR